MVLLEGRGSIDIKLDYCWVVAGVGVDLDMRWRSGCFSVVRR